MQALTPPLVAQVIVSVELGCNIHRPQGFDLKAPKRKTKQPRRTFEENGQEDNDSTNDEDESHKENLPLELDDLQFNVMRKKYDLE